MLTPGRYDSVAIALHWSIAALIGIAFIIGLTVDDFPKEMTGMVINIHALLGLTVLLLSVVRLFWRLGHPAPGLPATMAPLTRNLAKITHAGLYLLMVAVPIIGIPTLLWRGRGLDFGLFQIASPFARTPEIYRPLTEAHEIASFALVGLVAAHILAALYHQYIRRDAILTRMSPWRG